MTASNTPDNATNGYQYSQALGLENWLAGGGVTFSASGGGSFTAGTMQISKYRINGKTFHYHMKMTGGTITGTVIWLYVNLNFLLPSQPFAADYQTNTFHQVVGLVNSTDLLMARIENPFGPGFALQKVGANFTAGSTIFEVSLIAELA
jgi:hypothetical protein